MSGRLKLIVVVIAAGAVFACTGSPVSSGKSALNLPAVTKQPDCHPSYQGKCVPITSDVDCIGGSGDGPAYVGRVHVVGPDVYGLDRDGDGIGCEQSGY